MLNITSKGKATNVDTIRIKNNNMQFSINVVSGIQGDFFIHYCQTLNISSYGINEDESEEYFKVQLQTFCEDVMSMDNEERIHYLRSLGFNQEKWRNKNFSKSYIDSNGVLQNFDPNTVKQEKVEFA